jgi:hypothetical protein
LTDSQKRKIQGDACFLLIVCSLREQDPEQNLSHEVVQKKYWAALDRLIAVYQIPGDSKITCMIAALLLKLTRCSTVVKQLFSKWGEIVEK